MKPATRPDIIENGVEKALQTSCMQNFNFQIWKISIIFMKIIYSVFCMDFCSYLRNLQIPSYFAPALKEEAIAYIDFHLGK